MKIIWLVLGLWILMMVLMVSFQNRLIYPFDKNPVITFATPPTNWNLAVLRDGTIQVPSTVAPMPTDTWLWRRFVPDAVGTVVLFTGNVGAPGQGTEMAPAFLASGLNVVVMIYPGAAGTLGAPNEAEIVRRAQTLIDAVRVQEAPPILGVGGWSLGGGVATRMASLTDPDFLVALSPVSDLPAIARSRFWFFAPALPFVRQWDNKDAAREVARQEIPSLVVHGSKDSVVPFWQGELAAQLLRAEFLVLEEEDHDVLSAPLVRNTITSFLGRAIESK